jgi:hypothetical protein
LPRAEAAFNMPFEVEHIVPLSKDGLDETTNWALACRSCNLNKSNCVDSIDPVTQQRVRLFHPRQDQWAEHFVVDHNFPFNLQGRTPIGRATIAQLRVNSRLQLAARAQWMELRLFP